MAVYRTMVGALALAQETTEGTAETSLTQGVAIQNVQFTSNISMYERPVVVNSFGEFARIAGSKSATVTFEVCAVGATSLANLGTNGSEVHLLLLAAQFDDTLSASTSASYAPVTTDTAQMKSLTLRFHIDGLYWAMRGARVASLTFAMDKVGEPAKFRFTLTGVFDHEQAEASVPANAYIALNPTPWLASALTYATVALTVTKFEFTIDNGLVLRESANATDGFISARITYPKISGNISYEPDPVATFDTYSRIEDMTEAAFTASTGVNSTANKLTVTAPKMQLTGVSHENDGGLLKYNASFNLNRSSGNDAVVFLWAAG